MVNLAKFMEPYYARDCGARTIMNGEDVYCDRRESHAGQHIGRLLSGKRVEWSGK